MNYKDYMEMLVTAESLPRFITEEAFTTSQPDNTNWVLKPDWMTPAEFSQWIERKKDRLRRRLAADSSLFNSTEFRMDWDIAHAMERCGEFHVFGRR